MPLDIFMPFYGRVDHFKAAVESVLAQTSEDWRLIVVDDVYPDLEPGQWLQGLKHPRVTYIRNEVNLRPSKNYQKCVGLMESEFAVLMGCDDIMLPGYVARVHELIAQFPDAAIIQPGATVIDGDGNPYDPLGDRVKRWMRPSAGLPRVLDSEGLAASLLQGNWTYFPSLVWRVSELKKRVFNPELDVVQDLQMILEILRDGGRFVLDDQIVFDYRRHAGSVSSVTVPDGSRFVQEETLFTAEARRFATAGWPRAARAARRHWTSRLNALTELPASLRPGGAAGRRILLRHIFGR